MLSVVILTFCILFVILLVKLTTRSAEGKSRVLWIPTLWMLIVASRPVGRWFQHGSVSMAEGSEISGSLPDQIVIGMLILLALIILFKRRISWSIVLKENRWAFVLLLYIGASILWSDYTIVSFKRWVRVVGAVICAMVVMTEPQPFKALEVIIRRTAYVLIPFSIVLVKYFPELGIEYSRWSGGRMPIGVCLQKNGLGLLCTISAIFLIWDLLRKRRLRHLKYDKGRTAADILVLIMAFYLLKGADADTYSATAIGVFLMGLCVMLALSHLRTHPEQIAHFVTVFTIVAATTIIGVSSIIGSSPIGWLANLFGRNETLTGRVDIWDEIFKIAPRWSVLGTGFGGFWGLPYTFVPIGQMTGHNGYLDVFVELGVVGILILSLFLLSLWRRLHIVVKRDFDWGILGICFLLISLLYNYTESDYLNVSSPLWLIIIFMTFVLTGEENTKVKVNAYDYSIETGV